MALTTAQLMSPPGASVPLGAVTSGQGIFISPTGVISLNAAQSVTQLVAGTGILLNPGSGYGVVTITASGGGGVASSVAINQIPGIDSATNVQEGLEALELQAQDRIEFAVVSGEGLQATVSPPVLTSNSGTTLTITPVTAGVGVKGVTTLTNDFTGISQTEALTQYAASQLNTKIESLTGANVLAGTYDCSAGVVTSTTPAGAQYFTVGQQAPPADGLPDNYYLLVVRAGNQGPPGAVIPPTGVQSQDWFIVENQPGFAAKWITIDFENETVAAIDVFLSPVSGLSADNVQTAVQELESKAESSIGEIDSLSDGIAVVTGADSSSGRRVTLELKPATSVDLGGVFVQPGLGLVLGANGGLSLAPPVQIDTLASQFNGVDATFTLKAGGVNITPANSVSCLIVVGGIVQTANDSYTLSGSSITFSEPPRAGTSFYGVVFVQG